MVFFFLANKPADIVLLEEKNTLLSVCSLVGFWAGLDWLVLVCCERKHYWFAGFGWLKPTSEQAESVMWCSCR